MRQRGFGGRAGQRIPPNIERQFLEAHGGPGDQRELLVGVQNPPIVGVRRAPEAAPAPPPPDPPVPDPDDGRPRRQQPSQSEMLQRIGALETQNAELRAELEATSGSPRSPGGRASPPRQPPPPSPKPGAGHLAEALSAGVSRPPGCRGPAGCWPRKNPAAVLAGLTVTDASILDAVRPVCGVVTCARWPRPRLPGGPIGGAAPRLQGQRQPPLVPADGPRAHPRRPAAPAHRRRLRGQPGRGRAARPRGRI
ncbi:MAG: hypothetical protein R3F43_19210 [bacterium]